MEILSGGSRIGDRHIGVVLQTRFEGVIRELSMESSISIGVEERSNRSNLKHAFDSH